MARPGTRPAAELLSQEWDVVVIGGGNAALVTAMAAHDGGARVLMLERSDVIFRGGNSRHTRNIRCVHGDDFPYNTGAYTDEELWRDLCGVGTGPSDEALARLTVEESKTVPQWMLDHGALFQQPLAGTLHLGRTNTFFLGGGKALINNYYRTIDKLGIPLVYEAKVVDIETTDDHCDALLVECEGATHRLRATAFVAAAGGFEANIDWLAEYWGDAAYNYHIRGPRHNDGLVLRCLLDAGAQRTGEEKGFHSVAVDARSPKFDGGIATRQDCIPFGVVLNVHAKRFYDEGEDIWPKRYAIWGGNIARQPEQKAFAFWDATTEGQFLYPMYGAIKGDTIAEVAEQLGLDPQVAQSEVDAFNAACAPDARKRFDPSGKDGVSTTGVEPVKSNWAQPLDTPPFGAVPMVPGITFTYMGVKVDDTARIQREGGGRFTNLFAAGEIMSGNILSSGYMAGFGMTIGTVWGRIAGREAARHAVR